MISPHRLLQNLHRLRDFGRAGNGVVRRCLSPIDMESRHWLGSLMQEAGLAVRIDGISHDFAEDSREEDIVPGCQVLAEAVMQLLVDDHPG